MSNLAQSAMGRLQVLCPVLTCIIYFTCSCQCMIGLPVFCQECTGPECDVKPEGCRYGTVRDPCTDRYICRKGPGERCGGHYKMYGQCGRGMDCRCNRCTGCSLEHPNDCFFDLDFVCTPEYIKQY